MSDDQFEAHIKSTAWYGVLSRAAKDDDEGASIFRMARMAASEAWQASRNLIEQQAAGIAELEAQIAALAKRPVCVDCGDTIMAHDPGTCGTCHAVKYAALPGKAAMEEMRDKWKIVDGDCREGDDGLLTYHVDAFDEGYRAALATSVAPAVDAQPVAWFIADDNGEVYRATGYEHERDQWRAVGHEVFPLYASAQSEGWRKDAETWRNLLAMLIREIPQRYRRQDDPNAPGHAHLRPGIWDKNNGPLSGTQCAWCAVWNEARDAIDAALAKQDTHSNG